MAIMKHLPIGKYIKFNGKLYKRYLYNKLYFHRNLHYKLNLNCASFSYCGHWQFELGGRPVAGRVQCVSCTRGPTCQEPIDTNKCLCIQISSCIVWGLKNLKFISYHSLECKVEQRWLNGLTILSIENLGSKTCIS